MLTSLTSGITLSQNKGPNNPTFVFNYSCMVRQHVLENLEDVSWDSELIKYEKNNNFFYFFKFIQSTPLRIFFRTEVYPKKAMEHLLL